MEKIFLNNTNLHYALAGHLDYHIDIGPVRELFFVQTIKNAGYEIFHSKKGDYSVKKFLFEIGGKNKTLTQIKDEKNAWLILDDITSPAHKRLPLYYFGFLY